jgi:hypothetical protein
MLITAAHRQRLNPMMCFVAVEMRQLAWAGKAERVTQTKDERFAFSRRVSVGGSVLRLTDVPASTT